jgi:hypothetical protein
MRRVKITKKFREDIVQAQAKKLKVDPRKALVTPEVDRLLSRYEQEFPKAVGKWLQEEGRKYGEGISSSDISDVVYELVNQYEGDYSTLAFLLDLEDLLFVRMDGKDLFRSLPSDLQDKILEARISLRSFQKEFMYSMEAYLEDFSIYGPLGDALERAVLGTGLRASLIRLAYRKKSLRPIILPLLKR